MSDQLIADVLRMKERMARLTGREPNVAILPAGLLQHWAEKTEDRQVAAAAWTIIDRWPDAVAYRLRDGEWSPIYEEDIDV